MYTVKDLANELNIPSHKVYYDIAKGLLTAEKYPITGRAGRGFEYHVTDEEKERYGRSLAERPMHTMNVRTDIIPPCHLCGRIFERQGEYVVQSFEEDGVLSWHPICRRGPCSGTRKEMSEVPRLKAEIADLKLKNKRMALELQKIRQHLTNVLTREGYE